MNPITTEYSPYLSWRAAPILRGTDAADVAEQAIRNPIVRRTLGIESAAGYKLHYLHLGKAAPRKDHPERGLTRELTLQSSKMETVPQERRKQTNPIETRIIYLEYGKNDDSPDTEWEWLSKGSQLIAHKIAVN